MNTEEELKKRMLERKMYDMQSQQLQQQIQRQEIEEVLKNIIPQVLEKKARERLSNLKLIKPDLALQLEVYLVQLHQTGQIRGKITEEQLIAILKKISEKREFTIKRK